MLGDEPPGMRRLGSREDSRELHTTAPRRGRCTAGLEWHGGVHFPVCTEEWWTYIIRILINYLLSDHKRNTRFEMFR